jgi:hypothetical protein
MENWVKLDPETLADALAGRSVTACGEWVIGFQSGASGAMLHRNISMDESAGHAAGSEARAKSVADRQRIKDAKRAAGQLGNEKRWGDRKTIAEVSQCDDFASRKTIAEVSQEERRGEEKRLPPKGGKRVQAREPPPSSETPVWKVIQSEKGNKAEAARRKIEAARKKIDRIERLNPDPEKRNLDLREKIEKANAEIWDLENEILGLGLKP